MEEFKENIVRRKILLYLVRKGLCQVIYFLLPIFYPNGYLFQLFKN
jgi:hypothetical protein